MKTKKSEMRTNETPCRIPHSGRLTTSKEVGFSKVLYQGIRQKPDTVRMQEYNIKKPFNLTVIFMIVVVMSSFTYAVADASETGSSESGIQKKQTLDFWNGNRSAVRQDYEREVLKAILEATDQKWGAIEIEESLEEYPGNEESLVFTEKGHDLFVTIAGNQKFKEGDMIVIPHPLAKNLLGYRVPIIRKEDAGLFEGVNKPEDIQKLKHGIPETWSDATIFRHNGYRVVEKGSFDDIFDRLQNGLFDYSAYGANEVLGVYENPDLPKLAERIEQGLQKIIASGKLDALFEAHYGDNIEQLNLESRLLFVLENPLTPKEFSDLTADLENLQ